MADESQESAPAGYYEIDRIAKLLGFTNAERVRQLIKEGWIERGPRGMVSLVAAVQGYISFLKDRLNAAQRGQSENRVRDARAKEIELRVRQREGTLVPLADVVVNVDLIIGGLRAELDGLASGVSRDRDLRNRIQDRVDGAFNRASAKARKVAAQGLLDA